MQVDDLHLCLKCHSSTGVFKHFGSKNQLPGLSIIGTLVENGLMIVLTMKSFFRIKNKGMRISMKSTVLIYMSYSVYILCEFTIQSYVSVEIWKGILCLGLNQHKILQYATGT